MLEVNGGNDYKIRHLGKLAIQCESGEILPRTFTATDEALQVKELFTGDGGEVGNIGDSDSDAGAGYGAMEHMIVPLEAVRSQFICEKILPCAMMFHKQH